MELDLDFLDTVLDDIAPTKPRIRVRAGEVITNAMLAEALGIAMPEPEPARKRLDINALRLVPGMICPRCNGSGHSEWGACYWCTATSKPKSGWGILSHKDIALIEARKESRRAVCDVIAA
jgi:hypothetical protein